MYSPIPTLSDVLFYTPTDGYNYLTDNRPIYQLDSNIKALAQSLVGVGYGEHGSVNGDILTPGKGVELLPNGSIRYPDSSTVPSTAILGLAIGAAGAGLTKVIWGAHLLDLDVLGLAGIFSGSTPGYYIKVDSNITGNLLVTASISDSDLILGRVRSSTCISIGKDGQDTTISDTAAQQNYNMNFGVTRKRNLELLEAIDAAPVQFSKATLYHDSLASKNPFSIQYNSATGQVMAATIPASPVYGTDSNSWVIRETYRQFMTTEVVPMDSVRVYSGSTTTTRSVWSAGSFPTTLTGGLTNFELQVVGTSADYSTNLNLYKDFYITKYYQYFRATSLSDPLYGKVTATATILDPRGLGSGGETAKIIICDFMSYSVSGRETSKERVIISGSAADTLYADTVIFPSIIKV